MGPGLLHGALWFYLGLRALLGLRRQDFLSSTFLPRTVFAGRRGWASPLLGGLPVLGGLGGAMALPVHEGTFPGLVLQRAAASLGVPPGPWAVTTLWWRRGGAWSWLGWLVGPPCGAPLWGGAGSWKLGFASELTPPGTEEASNRESGSAEVEAFWFFLFFPLFLLL